LKGKHLKYLCAMAFTVGLSLSLNTNIAFANPNEGSEVTGLTSKTGIITADILNVRSDSNSSSGIIGKLYKNNKITILQTRNGWHRINFNNKTGWVYGEFVKLESSPEVPSVKSGEVNVSSLNVRQGAGTTYKVLGSISKGTKIQVLDSVSGWHKFNYNGVTAYVSSDYITLTSESSNEPSRPSRGEDTAPTFTEKTGVINVSALNFRTGPGTNNSIIQTLHANYKLTLIDESNGWYKATYNGVIGYVSKEFVTISQPPTTTPPSTPTPPPVDNSQPVVEGKVAIVSTDALNVRSGAGANFEKITSVRYGDKLPILAHSNGWYKISIGTTTGWISGDYVKVVNKNDSSNPLVKETALIESPHSGFDIVRKTEEYLGVPYVWGGFTPLGFDCSGLVQYVYRQLGIELERTTYYQVHQGVTVGRDDLQPGDLIFFTTDDSRPGSVSHVGIYKGNDLFIQAPKVGDVVRVSNLNSAYYTSRYYTAKRIIK
jgi:cell wall-associated NlpC family hydrolase